MSLVALWPPFLKVYSQELAPFTKEAAHMQSRSFLLLFRTQTVTMMAERIFKGEKLSELSLRANFGQRRDTGRAMTYA